MTAPAPEGGHRLLLVDDHRIFGEALASRLMANPSVADVSLAFSAAEVLPMVKALRPNLVLVDVALGEDSGLEVVEALSREFPGVPAVMVSAVTDISEIVRAFEVGARGWIPKYVSIDQFLAAVDEVLMGNLWVPPRMLSDVLEGLLASPPAADPRRGFVEELSPRQREILRNLSEGMSRQDIAERMGISHNTVRTHIQVLLKKADVHSTVALLARARQVGFMDEDHRGRN